MALKSTKQVCRLFSKGFFPRNKKAAFFTALSIIVIGILFVGFSPSLSFWEIDRFSFTRSRVRIANSFLFNIENVFIPEFVRVSGYDAMESALEFIEEGGSFYDFESLNIFFTNALVEGTHGNDEIERMVNNTLVYKLGEIEEFSRSKMRINTSFDNENMRISLFQSNNTGPWQFGVNIKLNFSVDAKEGKWERSMDKNISIPIFGLDDPYFFPEKREIFKTNFRPNEWNITTLDAHINEATYRYDNVSPSYLMRLYSDNSASECCGIHSMIDETAGPDDKSYVDFCFFHSGVCSEEIFGQLCSINGLSTEPFLLNLVHVEKYGVEGYAECSE